MILAHRALDFFPCDAKQEVNLKLLYTISLQQHCIFSIRNLWIPNFFCKIVLATSKASWSWHCLSIGSGLILECFQCQLVVLKGINTEDFFVRSSFFQIFLKDFPWRINIASLEPQMFWMFFSKVKRKESIISSWSHPGLNSLSYDLIISFISAYVRQTSSEVKSKNVTV